MRRLQRAPGLIVILSLGLLLSSLTVAWASPASSRVQRDRLTQHRVLDVSPRRSVSQLAHTGFRLATWSATSVDMRLSVGYDDEFRNGAWLPVRVTLTNRTSSTITGTVQMPNAQTQLGIDQSPAYNTTYQTGVVLPPGETKFVTLFVPALGVANKVDVLFTSNGKTLARRSDFPTAFGDSDFTLGVFTRDPSSALWLKHLSWGTMTTDTVFLTSSLIDRLPQALATFDVIAVTNADTAQLDTAQLSSLKRYVEDGGSLLLVGGPDWQQSLQPLAAALAPGRLEGSRRISDFTSLGQFGDGASPPDHQATVVSVLQNPKGQVLAGSAGVPLVVRRAVGLGAVEYLAFDPSLAPFSTWAGAGYSLSHLVVLAAPAAAARTGLPYGSGPSGTTGTSIAGSVDMTGELSNVSTAALPSLLLFVILAAVYVLLLGPVNFLLLFRLRKRELSWITIPALAGLYLAVTFFAAFHLKGRTVLLNTIGIVNLAGNGPDRPAALFLGLFAPVRGDYHLVYSGATAAASLPPALANATVDQSQKSVGAQITEGAQTVTSFLSMSMWSMRDVSLDGSLSVPGRIVSALHPDPAGYLVGTVHNGLTFTLLRPAVLAGSAVEHLPDIPAGGTLQVRIKPAVDTSDPASSLWQKVYGGPQPTTSWTSAQGGIPFLSQPTPGPITNALSTGPCCSGPPAPEHSLHDRIQNVASQLLQAESPLISSQSVEIVAWSDRALVPFSVDGTSPQRRDLTLILAPLTLRLQPGAFRLGPGAAGPRLVDVMPSTPTSCCTTNNSSIYLAPGGFATFEFDLPEGTHAQYRTLHLTVNTGGADGTRIGQLYDWPGHKWEYVDLSTGEASVRSPARFVSGGGALLLKLSPTEESGDISLDSPAQDLEIAGTGVAAG